VNVICHRRTGTQKQTGRLAVAAEQLIRCDGSKLQSNVQLHSDGNRTFKLRALIMISVHGINALQLSARETHAFPLYMSKTAHYCLLAGRVLITAPDLHISQSSVPRHWPVPWTIPSPTMALCRAPAVVVISSWVSAVLPSHPTHKAFPELHLIFRHLPFKFSSLPSHSLFHLLHSIFNPKHTLFTYTHTQLQQASPWLKQLSQAPPEALARSVAN
jgi:hypothetical protein